MKVVAFLYTPDFERDPKGPLDHRRVFSDTAHRCVLGYKPAEALVRESELLAANALLREFIELSALGDVDRNTEAYGWGNLIQRAEEHLKPQRG